MSEVIVKEGAHCCQNANIVSTKTISAPANPV